MAWRLVGAKPFFEPVLVIYWRIYVSLGRNELNLQVPVPQLNYVFR